MTEVSQAQETEGTLCHITFVDTVEKIELRDLVNLLDYLDPLVWLAVLPDAFDTARERMPGKPIGKIKKAKRRRSLFPREQDELSVGSWEEQLTRSAMMFASMSTRHLRVHRLSYGSPVEIWFYVGETIGVGTASFSSLTLLFNRFQKARVNKANADLQVTALKVLQDSIAPVDPGGITEETRLAVVDQMQRASRALAAIDTITEEAS